MALLIRRLVKTPRNACISVSALSSTRPGRQGPYDELDQRFNSPIDAFKSKTTGELVRAYFVYQMCSINWLVENNAVLMKRLQQVVGKRLFESIMKATFYGQFVAGEDTARIQPTIDRLHSFGVKSILDYSVEEDLSQEEAEKREVKASVSSVAANDGKEQQGNLKQFQVEQRFADRRQKITSPSGTYFYENEQACEKNMEAFLMSIDAVHKATKSTGFMALKVTALGRPQLLLQLSEVIMSARNYMQSIGGGSGCVLAHHKTIEDFERYFKEHKDKPEVKKFVKHVIADKKGILHLFPWSNILTEDMDLSETFRVPDPKTGQMRRLISQISTEEQRMFRNMLRRLNTVIQTAEKVNVRIMVDAEQTYFQPAISRITLEMMRRYNKDKFLVFNTYQTYLKNTHNEILADLEQAQRQNFHWAAKNVRGAYIEQERARAAAMGYEDPTCESYEATSKSYNDCMKTVISKASSDMKGRIAIMIASHNEDSVRYALKLMKEYDINPDARIVCFGQLLGMSDHITFPLGQAGYSAYKYVPYGPVVEVLPYMSRRAYENRGLLSKVKKERRLLRAEIGRRIVSGQIFYKPEGKYTPV